MFQCATGSGRGPGLALAKSGSSILPERRRSQIPAGAQERLDLEGHHGRRVRRWRLWYFWGDEEARWPLVDVLAS